MVETAAGRLVFGDFTRPASRCIGCGACAAICLTGAIRVEDQSGSRATIIAGTVVRKQAMLSCDACHRPFVTEAQFRTTQERLGRQIQPLCPSLRAGSNHRQNALYQVSMRITHRDLVGALRARAIVGAKPRVSEKPARRLRAR